MGDTVTIDKAGRVVIPKRLRDELQLAPGDSLALEFDGERVVLKPVQTAPIMRKKRGIWVLSGGPKPTEDDTRRMIEEARLERERRILGLEE